MVEVPTTFTVAWLERRMYQSIQKTVEKVTGGPADIQFQVKAGNAGAGIPPAGSAVRVAAPNSAPSPAAAIGLLAEPAGELTPTPAKLSTASIFNPRYGFNSFVVGPSNRLAFSTAQASWIKWATSYAEATSNPLNWEVNGSIWRASS